ncbi:MAG: deoxyribonuclease IV [Candidatus Sumerlaeia bacterium]|nr:deoxyribonuclease IV [Candidatus Sumerlaeia bacterium]
MPHDVPQNHFIGSHMSIAGGIHLAVERAVSVGCRALQIFVKNSNRWEGPPISGQGAADYRAAIAGSGIAPEHVFAHTSYLINLASPKDDLGEKSLAALVDELRRCEQLGVPGLVMHPGSPGAADDAAIERIGSRAARALREAGGSTRLLYETTAGTGQHLGRTFEEIAALLDATGLPDRVGCCMDTCHIFAAGYELRRPEAFAETMARFDATVGFRRLCAVHLNDSQHALGSRKDRHEHIGEGELGEQPFRLLLADARFRTVPMALETEKGDDLAEDRMNLATLARLST